MNNILLEGKEYTYGEYTVKLVDNQRNYEIYKDGEKIYRKGACWATYYEVCCIIGIDKTQIS